MRSHYPWKKSGSSGMRCCYFNLITVVSYCISFIYIQYRNGKSYAKHVTTSHAYLQPLNLWNETRNVGKYYYAILVDIGNLTILITIVTIPESSCCSGAGSQPQELLTQKQY